ncbi:hypothetical protein SK128_001488, partial [Halocaridina rubra]
MITALPVREQKSSHRLFHTQSIEEAEEDDGSFSAHTESTHGNAAASLRETGTTKHASCNSLTLNIQSSPSKE